MDNPIVCKDADHYAVWGYIMHYAAHAPSDVLFNGRRITLQPGQLITGRHVIAKKFGISDSKVKRILQLFESDQQIDRQRSSTSSLISVINWELYQCPDQQNDQQVTSERPASDQRVTTIQEDKKIRTIRSNKKDRGESDLKTSEEKEKSCAKKETSPAFEKFRKWISENAPNVGRLKEPFTEDEFMKLKQDFPIEQIQEILQDMHNWKPLLTKNINTNRTFRKWAQKNNDEKANNSRRVDPSRDKQFRDTEFTEHIAAKMRGCAEGVPDPRRVAPEF